MKLDVKQIFIGVIVGTILGAGAAIIFQSKTNSRLETQNEIMKSRIEHLEERFRLTPGLKVPSNPIDEVVDTINSEKRTNDLAINIDVIEGKLLEIVHNQQRLNVPESTGPADYECFTEADLETFIKNREAHQVASALKMDANYIRSVIELANYPKYMQSNVLNNINIPFRKTWGELNKITPEGQTQAGQEAELLIANAIVEQTQMLLDKDAAELNRLISN